MSLVESVIIFYEIAFIVLLIAIVVFCARPLFEAYSHRIRTDPKAIVDGTSQLEAKVQQLESEVMELRQQVRNLQESADFAAGLAQAQADKLVEKGKV